MKISIKHLLMVLLVIRLVFMIFLAGETSETVDEPKNLKSAIQSYETMSLNRIKDSEMPVTIPDAVLGQWLLDNFPMQSPLVSYRMAGIVLSQFIVPISYMLAIELGASSLMALLFTLMVSFDPNLLGHSILINVDGMMATFFPLLAWAGARWSKSIRDKDVILFGFILGLLQGVKFSAAWAIPVCIVWIVGVLIRSHQARHITVAVVKFSFSLWLGLSLIYGFNRMGTPLGDINFRSPPFQQLQTYLYNIPAFVPVDYLRGLDWVYSIERNKRYVFLRGEHYDYGIWYYYLYALALKCPIPTLLLFLWGWGRKCAGSMDVKAAFVLFLFGTLFLYFSVLFHNQIGIRYIFPIYPLFLLGMIWIPQSRGLMAACLMWLGMSMSYQWPDYIGYFNEILRDRKERWWHISDSNLSWRQDDDAWRRYVAENQIPINNINPLLFPIGEVFYQNVLLVQHLWGMPTGNEDFVRQMTSAFDSFGNSWLAYKILPDDIAKHAQLLKQEILPDNSPPCLNNDEMIASGVPWSLASSMKGVNVKLSVPEDGNIFIQINSAAAVNTYLNHELIMPAHDMLVKKWAPNYWNSAYVFLRKGNYVLNLEPPASGLVILPARASTIALSAYRIADKNQTLQKADRIPLCNFNRY